MLSFQFIRSRHFFASDIFLIQISLIALWTIPLLNDKKQSKVISFKFIQLIVAYVSFQSPFNYIQYLMEPQPKESPSSKDQELESSIRSLSQVPHEQNTTVSIQSQSLNNKVLNILEKMTLQFKSFEKRSYQIEQKMESLFNTLNKKIDQNNDVTNRKIEALDRKIDQSNDVTNRKIEALDRKIDQKNEALHRKIDQNNDVTNRKIEALDRKIDRFSADTNQRFTENHRNIIQIRDDIYLRLGEIGIQIETLSFFIDSNFNESKIDHQTLSKTIQRIQFQIKGIKKDIEQLRFDVPQSDRNFRAELAQTRENIQILDVKLVEMQQKFNELKKDLPYASEQKPDLKKSEQE